MKSFSDWLWLPPARRFSFSRHSGEPLVARGKPLTLIVQDIQYGRLGGQRVIGNYSSCQQRVAQAAALGLAYSKIEDESKIQRCVGENTDGVSLESF